MEKNFLNKFSENGCYLDFSFVHKIKGSKFKAPCPIREREQMANTEKKRISKQFCCFCTTVLRNAAIDIQRQQNRKIQLEKPIPELSSGELLSMVAIDDYFESEHIFKVFGKEVVVIGDLLADALRQLPSDRRDIILMSYFMGMSDAEIGRKLNIIQQTIYKRRKSSLKALSKILSKEDFE